MTSIICNVLFLLPDFPTLFMVRLPIHPQATMPDGLVDC